MEEKNPLLFLSELQDFIEKRHEEMPEGSYTTSLFKDGLNRMAQKVGEEALELVIEATNGTNDRLIYEGSDMLYHLIVLLTSKGLRIEDLAAELAERHNPGWKKHWFWHIVDRTELYVPQTTDDKLQNDHPC